ncbi:MAG: hypothetical protein DI570_09280 [Phenylobacterium zucineum]|nr:MAG: hypothetical protein DI570_09280 [Phenylobacterium zucineum]
MSLSPSERHRMRGLWSALVRASIIPDPEALADLGPVAVAAPWASPFDERWKSFALFGFAQLALAFVRAPERERRGLVGALSEAAVLAQRLLAEEGPPQNTLPFRADIDG